MLTKLKYPFEPTGHKSMMLYLLIVTLIGVHLLSAGVDLIRHRYLLAEIKTVTLVLLGVIYYLYIRMLDVERFATGLLLLMEVELTLLVVKNDFLHFSTVYPMLLTFGLFFFFSLKKALWLTLGHCLYWLGWFVYGYLHYPHHMILHDSTAVIGMAIAYFFMTLFGLFYAFSVETAYRKLERSNRQKSILLSEIHHRIKNNLNMMASVLGLQIMNLKSRKTKDSIDALLNAKLRIQAMAMVHESIYKQKDFDEISFYNYTHALTKVINQSYDADVAVEVESNYIYLPLAVMIHLGIIINELFTNSIKYAFSDATDNAVVISLSDEGEHYRLVYHENHNRHIDIERMMHSDTLGIKLIKLIVRQIDGVLDVSRNEGLKFTITFPKMQ